MNKITIVLGTRPEIIKMAPIIRELKHLGKTFTIILSGQHYDYNLSEVFIKELNLPYPDFNFKLNNKSPASQIGEIMEKLENILIKQKSNLLLIQGDTNTMLAAALTGVKLGIKIGHVEAGLRSYDWRMPEEHNRRMVDHISDILFAPTERAKINLIEEKVYGRVFITGNTVIDAVHQHLPIAEEKSQIMEKIKFEKYALVTIHRVENVEYPKVLKNLVKSLLKFPIPIVFPIHPRTKKCLYQNHLGSKLEKSKKIQLLPPLGYFDFLKFMKECTIIATDSGGLQEEATAPLIKKPVIILRNSTERPETIEAGFAILAGVEMDNILKAVNNRLKSPLSLPNKSPFGDGKAAKKIIKIISCLNEE